MPPLDLIRDTFEATARANVRSGPGREYAVVEVLASGERVQVIGRIEDADWYVIARNGVASGFVASSLLRPAREPASTAVASSPPPGAERVEVEAVRTCRVLVQKVQLADGREVEEHVEVCPGPNGWKVRQV